MAEVAKMTIKEVAAKVGLSHQAIYKRLRARGKRAEDIVKAGVLTEEGEALMMELFPSLRDEPQPSAESPSEVEKRLQDEVAKLQEKVVKLGAEVARLEERAANLTEERDYLRKALDQSQQLQAMTTAKIPSPPAITSGEKKKRLLSWIRGKKGGE